MEMGPDLLLIVCLLALPATTQAQKTAPQASSKPRSHPVATLDPGRVIDGVYRNAQFGFSFNIPFGWVERTDQMQEDSEAGKSATLLAVFERPPEATGDTVNSTVVIAAESLSLYPGLKDAADYFDPLNEIAAKNGFKVDNDPYEYVVGGKQLVRGDFTKQAGTVTYYQASLVELTSGYAVSFTFIAENQDEADELIENLTFPKARK